MEANLTPVVNAVSVSLADAERRYKLAAETILEAYEARRPKRADQVTPVQLHAAIEHFLVTSRELERALTEAGTTDQDEVSELGDYGIILLMDLGMWAQQLGLDELESELDQIALGFADWIIRHQGEIRTLEPVVDALANLANRARDTQALEGLTNLMTRVVHAAAAGTKHDMGKTHPSRPWRVLNLNRGIVATRTHNTDLIEQVFAELVQHLPTEAQQFFAEGMQQMDALKYPPHVREIMARYFDRWTRRGMH